MKQSTLLAVVLMAAVLGVNDPASAQEPTGTLVFRALTYESDVKMKPAIRSQLEHAGIRWGMVEHTLVVTLISTKFVKADMPHLTRYGDETRVELEPGEYSVTCIGHVLASTSKDVNNVLSKSAFFNLDILSFTIQPGETTVIEVLPVYQKQKKTGFARSQKMFIPEYRTKVLGGENGSESIVISARTGDSIAWDDYEGPLKF